MDKKINHLEIGISTAVYLLTGNFFCLFLKELYDAIDRIYIDGWNLLCLIWIVVIVNLIKALRLYIILFGNQFSKTIYFMQYFKTSFVNSLLPFKSGELYRGFCIGKIVGSYTEGYIAILFDRFVDTLALLSVIIFLSFFFGMKIKIIYIFLIIFLVLMMLIYLFFIPFYQYWNRFLIFYKSSEHTLSGLYFLEKCKEAFEHIRLLVKGRFLILYLISIFAWGLETATLFLGHDNDRGIEMSTYLSAILTGKTNKSNLVFIAFSLGLFLGAGLFLKLGIKRKEANTNATSGGVR